MAFRLCAMRAAGTMGTRPHRLMGQGAMLKIWCLAMLLSVSILGGGCAVGPIRKTADEPVPPDISRDDLLTVTAACHLLRVGQTTDVGATDVVVIAAVEQFGFSVEEVLDRSEELVGAFQSKEQDLADGAKVACDRLAEYTGEQPALVRFRRSGDVSTTWVHVSGEIDRGFAERTIARLRRNKAIGLIIDSPGGSVYEARKLGYYLRNNGLRVGVAGLCASACIDVLAGGVERYVTSEARLGIHQSKVPKRYSSHEGGQLYVAESALYLREMGVDDAIALVAATVPKDEMRWISLADAFETRLVTDLVSEKQ